MLRSNLQLTADMIFNQPAKKDFVSFIGKKIIKSDARADKNAFYPGKRTNSVKNSYILAVISIKIFTAVRESDNAVGAYAVPSCLSACRSPKIRPSGLPRHGYIL